MWIVAAIFLLLVAPLPGYTKLNRPGAEDPALVTCRALKKVSESMDAIIDNLPCEDVEDTGKKGNLCKLIRYVMSRKLCYQGHGSIQEVSRWSRD